LTRCHDSEKRTRNRKKKKKARKQKKRKAKKKKKRAKRESKKKKRSKRKRKKTPNKNETEAAYGARAVPCVARARLQVRAVCLQDTATVPHRPHRATVGRRDER
jgi:hypothetical protein